MSTLIMSQRYNWMGYNGTESREIDKVFVRGGDDAGIFDYWRRRSVIEDIKKQLHLIKGDLDLIPEEELRAEREIARRRRAEREATELENHKQEGEQGEEYQYQKRDERSASQTRFEERMREIMQRTAGISESECNSLLENMPHTKAEAEDAVNIFSTKARGFLVSKGAYYISYLDGSWHTSLEGLDRHNVKYESRTERALEGTGVSLPDAKEYSTAQLHDAVARLETEQKKLQAYFCQKDHTHTMRLRKADKDEKGYPIVVVKEEDGNEAALRKRVDDALVDLVLLRKAYNKRSGSCGQRLLTYTINSKKA